MDEREVEVFGLKIPMFEARMIVLSSVMQFPLNLEARESYVRTVIGAGLAKLRDANSMPPIPHETALALLAGERNADALTTCIANDTVRSHKRSSAPPISWGALAGLELIKSLQIYHATKGERAHAEARYQIIKSLAARPFDYKGLNRTERLRKNWQKYAGCSHLYAAFVLHGSLPENEIQLQVFASVAEHLRELGMIAQSRFAADPILSASLIWALDPEFPRIGVSIDFDQPFPVVRFKAQGIALLAKP